MATSMMKLLRCSNKLRIFYSTLKVFRETQRKHKYRLLCVASGAFVQLSCDSKLKIQEPDVSTLSREYLIKSSSILTAENASILLTQTALALQQAEKEYKEALLAVNFLLEFKLTVLGNPQEEARIWDLIIEGRSLVASTKRTRDDLEMVFKSAEYLLNTAAEITYMTGADLVGSCAGDRLIKINRLVRDDRLKSEEAEKKLQDTEIKAIDVEGQYAVDHAEEIENERQELLQDTVGTEADSKSKPDEADDKQDEDPDIIDIISNYGESLGDNTAKEL